MHDFNVRMIKVIIVTMVFSMVVIMISGMKILENSYYWRNQYFLMHWDYAKTKLDFIEYEYGGLVEWIKSKQFNGENKTIRSKGKAESVPILLYHGVIDDSKWTPDEVNIKLSDFQDHMFALKKAGYETINVEEYLAFSRGEKDLPPKVFMLTFDDGRKDSYYPVDPILRVLGFSAVMHIITGRSLGADNEKGVFHLSEMELKKMIESGRWEMESHGSKDHGFEDIDSQGARGHFLSNKIWVKEKKRLETSVEYKNRIKKDLLESKNDLDKKLGITTQAYAYPFGDYGQESVNFPESQEFVVSIASSIFPITFYQVSNNEFPRNYIGDKTFLTKRISIEPEMSTDELLWMMEKTKPKPSKYTDNFFENNGWLPGWGLVGVSNKKLIIGARDKERSAHTFLGGSYLWDNYFAQADIQVKGGNAFAVTARYKDGNNYVSCNYYDKRMILQQRVAGVDKPETKLEMLTGLSDGEKAKIGISVVKNVASCFLNGKKVIIKGIDPALDHGGLSFSIWNSIPRKKAYLLIDNLEVYDKNISAR